MDKRLATTYDFLGNVIVSDPQVSPDGSKIIFVRKQVGPQNSYDRSIWIAQTSGEQPQQFTSGYDDFQPRWSPDGQRIAFIRGDGHGEGQLSILPVDGGEATPLTFFPDGTFSEIVWSSDGQWLAVSFRERGREWTRSAKAGRRDLGLSDPPIVLDSLWYRCDGEGYFGSTRHTLHLVNTWSGEAFEVYNKDVMGRFSFDFSPDSKRLVIAANTDPLALLYPWNDQLFLFDIAKHRLSSISGVPACKKFRVRWSPDGNSIAFGGFLGEYRSYCPDNVELFVCNPSDGSTRSVTAKHDLCFQGHLLADGVSASLDPNYQWTADSRSLVATVGHHGQKQVVSIDVTTEDLRFLTTGNYHNTIGNCSRDGDVWAVIRGSATALPEIFVGRLLNDSFLVEPITDFNRSFFDEIEVSEPQEHWVESADGTKVQVWVVRPPHLEPGDQTAAILTIHGGPHAYYGYGYLHDVQVLAGQGYTVFYSNPRGSKGYGRAFSKALCEKWGHKDWEDIQAVVAFMQKYSSIDAARMGVIGASYGGYMANWLVSHSDAFVAAVSDRAVCNLISQFGTTDLPRLPAQSWDAAPWHHPEILWDQSPLKYVHQVKTPTLILHAEGDLRVNIEQAEQWFTSLSILKVPVSFVRYPKSANHHMAGSGPPDLRLHRLEQIVMWFESHL